MLSATKLPVRSNGAHTTPFTVTTALETSMRKLFILTALIFAFFTGATAAVVGAAIYTQTAGTISAEAN